MNKLERKMAQETANIINRLAQDDPTWLRFLSRQPRYRYFPVKGSSDRPFWTVETVKVKGKPRYASGVYRFVKSRQVFKLVQPRYHVRRRDAKARALGLWHTLSKEVSK